MLGNSWEMKKFTLDIGAGLPHTLSFGGADSGEEYIPRGSVQLIG